MRWLPLLLLVFALTVYADTEETGLGQPNEDPSEHPAKDYDGDEKPDEYDSEDDGDEEHHGGLKVGEHDEKQAVHHTWSYHLDHGKTGQAMWGELFPDKCGAQKNRQSPINIIVDDTVHNDKLSDIDIIRPPKNESNKRMYFYNNGHSAQVNVENAELYIVGGGLPSEYRVAQFHFHWGSSDKEGSEHRVNNKKFPLELHVVTYDAEKFSTLGEAVSGHNSVAVFGTLFRLTEEENGNLNPIVERLNEIANPGKEFMIQLPWINIRSLMPPVTNKYFRYEGSLTTPTCDESVVWTVFALPSYVSHKQLAEFRQLIEGHDEAGDVVALEDNWRAPQSLKGRKVEISFVPEAEYDRIMDKKGKKKNTAAASTDNGANTLYLFSFVPLTFLYFVIVH